MKAARSPLERRYELRNRYHFEGKLRMKTALHIGGGRVTLSPSDSPVVLTPDEKPFIPGSSFKGALRSTIEKLAPMLPDLSACGLPTRESVDDKNACPTSRQQEERKKMQEQAANLGRAYDADIALREARSRLCHACQLFGSPYEAARIKVNDLYLSRIDDVEQWSGAIQVRDGVAIDRDSEKAKDKLKYDFEVVPAQASFDLSITLENATRQDLQLLCVGLSEYVHGFGVIGGKRSRGLGACELRDLTIHELVLAQEEGEPTLPKEESYRRLKAYLLNRELIPVDTHTFLEKQITSIFEPGGEK